MTWIDPFPGWRPPWRPAKPGEWPDFDERTTTDSTPLPNLVIPRLPCPRPAPPFTSELPLHYRVAFLESTVLDLLRRLDQAEAQLLDLQRRHHAGNKRKKRR